RCSATSLRRASPLTLSSVSTSVFRSMRTVHSTHLSTPQLTNTSGEREPIFVRSSPQRAATLPSLKRQTGPDEEDRMDDADDLGRLSGEDLATRVAAVRSRMRPLETQLAGMRAERDVLLTELRRRERQSQRGRRAGVKEAMRAGQFPTFTQLVAASESGSFDDFAFHLKT